MTAGSGIPGGATSIAAPADNVPKISYTEMSNVVPVVAANRIGNEHGQVFYGSSFIANHRGDKIAEMGRTDEGIILANLDLAEVRRNRAAFGFFRDRRPESYGRLVDL